MKFIIYPDKRGESRWKLVEKNGSILADSGEGYNNPGNARRAIKAWVKGVHTAKIETQKGQLKAEPWSEPKEEGK